MNKMTHDIVRQVIPAEISEKGGARLRLVNGRTIPLETSLKEAKAAGYVLGDETLVRRQFEGLVQSMRDGTESDGMARQIGNWVTVYPVFVGPIDLTRGFDPEKNGVRIRMRLLNELDVDITDWEFRDVTPGRTPFSIDSASTGELVNAVKIGDPVHVNGRPFPPKEALRVDWAVDGTDKSGTIPAAKFASDATLITLDADALDELKDETYDGKTIVFTVRGNFSSAKIAATLKYVALVPTVTNLTTGEEPDTLLSAENVKVIGENFDAKPTDVVQITRDDTDVWEWSGEKMSIVDPDGEISLGYMNCLHNGQPGNFYLGTQECDVTVHYKGATRTAHYAGTQG